MMSPQTWQSTTSRSLRLRRPARAAPACAPASACCCISNITDGARSSGGRSMRRRRSGSSPPRRRAASAAARSPTVRIPSASRFVGRQVLDREPPEDVVDEARREPDVGVVGHARGLEAHVREHLDERLERHAVLEAVAHRDRERVHDAGERRALLRDLEEQLAGATVFVLADRHVAVAVGDPERERLGCARARQLLANRLLHDHGLDDALDLLLRRSTPSVESPAFFCVDSGWPTLQLSR